MKAGGTRRTRSCANFGKRTGCSARARTWPRWPKSWASASTPFGRWRNQYGGMKADDAKELRRLKDENGRLKRMVADRALDIEMLKEVARGNF